MSSSSGRAQTEPIAALAAVFALGVGLSLYAGVLDATLPAFSTDRDLAPTAADRLQANASSFGAVTPPLAQDVAAARPTGHRLNATVRTDEGRWAGGPPRPSDPDCVERRVPVRVATGRVRPGVMEVCVWRAA
jgi:hypothetical protein